VGAEGDRVVVRPAGPPDPGRRWELLERVRRDGAADRVVIAGGVNEIRLLGGAVAYRPTGPWTPLVHGLLQHVRTRGFAGAPIVYGIGADGREAVSFRPGEVSDYPLSTAARSEAALVSAAGLLRRYHEATVGSPGLAATGWMLPVREPVEVVCHGDFAPYNCVLDGDEAVGIIDFDTAHPGPRLWDIGYAVYRWAPLTAPDNRDGFGTLDGQVRRARRFCDAYGLDDAGRAGLADAVIDRVEALVAFMRAAAAAGDTAFQGHLAAGHDRLYEHDVAYVRANRDVIGSLLTAAERAG
jgi:hypothetical protein